MKNARLILAIITNLLDEAIIIAAIVFGLPRLGVYIPLWGTILICVAFLIYATIFYRIGSTILRKRPLPGLSDMVGMEGKAVSNLNPDGLIRIQGELWKARSQIGTIKSGDSVIVTGQTGLKLLVSRK